MNNAIELLDKHYSAQLGCSPADMNADGVRLVSNPDLKTIRWAKGCPLAVFSIAKADGAVISVQPELAPVVQSVVKDNGALPYDYLCDRVQTALEPLVESPEWFRGIRLYCDASVFVDRSKDGVRNVTHIDDEHVRHLHAKWGGEVFGQIVDGRVVSWAAIKPLSDIVWDLSIETLPDYRGHGYARSAVSAALACIFENGKVAAWGCDRENAASLATARGVGFRDYGLEFGCIGLPLTPSLPH